MPMLYEMITVVSHRVIIWAYYKCGRVGTVADTFANTALTTAAYVCGPLAMLESVRTARYKRANVPRHYERFSV